MKQKRNKRFFYFTLIFIFLIFFSNLVYSSKETLGTFKQGTNINLIQTCANCTYSNITSIVAPDGEILISKTPMTKDGSYYNYTLPMGKSVKIGEYLVNGLADLDGQNTVWGYNFFVTPSGNKDVLGFYILIFSVVYTLALIGFFGKNEIVTIFGALALISLGIYSLNNGIDVFRNQITEGISFLTIGLGGFLGIVSGISLIKDNL